MIVRTRTSGAIVRPYSGEISRTLCNGTTLNIGLRTSLVETGSLKTTTDVVTPRFRTLSNKGVIINNPFSSTTVDKQGSVSGSRSVTFNPTCYGGNVKTDVLPSAYADQGSPIWPSWNDTELRDSCATEAATKALSNITSSEVMGLVEIAEISKTFRMINRPLENIHNFISEVKSSRNYKKKRSAFNSFGGFMTAEWLRYRYGIIPACSTIQSALGIVNTVKQSPRYTARGFSSRVYADLVGTPVIDNRDTFSVCTHTGSKSGNVFARAGVLYEHRFELQDRTGLRLSDVPSAAWELVPYSFIADWFVNVGDYISAITPKAGVKVLSSWTGYTEQTIVSTQELYSAKSVSPFTIIESRKGNQVVTTTHKSRWPSVSAGLVRKQITFDRPSDWDHLADSLSLLVQRLR